MKPEYFQNNIHFVRRYLNLSQSEFAKLLDVSRGTIATWETGEIRYMPDEKAVRYFNKIREHPDFPDWINVNYFLGYFLNDVQKYGAAAIDIYGIKKLEEMSKEFGEEDNQKEIIEQRNKSANAIKIEEFLETPPKSFHALSLSEFLSDQELQKITQIKKDEAIMLGEIFTNPFIRYQPDVYYGALLMYRKIKEGS